MNKFIISAITVLFASLAIVNAAPDKDAIIANEKAAWQAFKDRKADDFKKLLSPSLMAVYSDAIVNLQQEVDRMPKMDMKSFELSEMNVVFPDPQTAVITYKAKVDAMQNGQDASGMYNCGSIWRMMDKKWLGVFHSDMKAETAAAPDAQKKE